MWVFGAGVQRFETSSYGADEAGVVPLDPQGLQELVAGLDGEVAAVAIGSKHGVVV